MDFEIPKELWLPIVGAALTFLGQSLLGWWRQPKLAIDIPDGPGFRIDRAGQDRNGNVVPLVWLRVRVRNTGRSAAKNVKVFVTRYGKLRAADAEKQRLETDPAPLYWSHSSHYGQIDARLVSSLPAKTHQFVDFVVAEESQSPVLRLNSTTDDGQFLSAALSGGGAEVEFMALDDAGNSAFGALGFVWDGTSTSLRWKL